MKDRTVVGQRKVSPILSDVYFQLLPFLSPPARHRPLMEASHTSDMFGRTSAGSRCTAPPSGRSLKLRQEDRWTSGTGSPAPRTQQGPASVLLRHISQHALGHSQNMTFGRCVWVCVYLSDGLRDPVAAAGVCEAHGRVHADPVSNRHVNRFGAAVRASQSLKRHKRLHRCSGDTLKVAVLK